jgi:hypothetical protein
MMDTAAAIAFSSLLLMLLLSSSMLPLLLPTLPFLLILPDVSDCILLFQLQSTL